jgi:hypothetical protein
MAATADAVTWRAHPLAQQPARSAAFGVLAAAVWALAAWAWGPWGLLLVAAFTVLPGAAYLFPTTYRLDAAGVSLGNPFASDCRPWSRFVAYREYPDAVQLLFDDATARGWWLRGHLLYFNGNRGAVMAAVRRRLPAATGPAPARTPPPPVAGPPPGTPARRVAGRRADHRPARRAPTPPAAPAG